MLFFFFKLTFFSRKFLVNNKQNLPKHYTQHIILLLQIFVFHTDIRVQKKNQPAAYDILNIRNTLYNIDISFQTRLMELSQ